MILTADRLKEVINYNPETGEFRRLDRYGKPDHCGAIRTRLNRHTKQYLLIGVDGTQYLAHRLAWLYVYGEWPSPQIDHINGDGLDNRLTNLRLASPSQNRVNADAQKHSRSGVRGIHAIKSGIYRVQLQKDGRSFHVGYFDNFYDAITARNEAYRQIHGSFARIR